MHFILSLWQQSCGLINQPSPQAIRLELQGASRLRDSVAEGTSEQGRLVSSVQDARAALAQLQCQHDDLNGLKNLRMTKETSLVQEHSTLKVWTAQSYQICEHRLHACATCYLPNLPKLLMA